MGKRSGVSTGCPSVEGTSGSSQLFKQNSATFNDIVRQMRTMVIPCMDKQLRRQYELQKVRALGGHLPKGENVPFPVLKERRQQFKERMEKLKEEAIHTGVSFTKHKHADIQTALRVNKRKRAMKARKQQQHAQT